MFRIYRDTRFRKDKTPYKTHFSAAIRDRAKRGLEPGYYFEIDHRGILHGRRRHLSSGARDPETHPPATSPTSRRRSRRCCANPRFSKTYGGLMDEDALARPPKGFSADLKHIDAIKQRHYFGLVEVNIKRKPPKDLAADLAGYFEDLLPLMNWLRKAGAER